MPNELSPVEPAEEQSSPLSSSRSSESVATETSATARLSSETLIGRILGGEPQLYEVLMRRNNGKLFRLIRGIAGSSVEAEDVMQEAYVRAYTNLASFEGRAQFSTWLARIAIHEALARARQAKSFSGQEPSDQQAESDVTRSRPRTPEQAASDRELAQILEAAIDDLPDEFRAVFTLRALHQMSVSDVADSLEILPETVKTRFFRARLRLRRVLLRRLEAAQANVFYFHLSRCDRVVAGTFERLSLQSPC